VHSCFAPDSLSLSPFTYSILESVLSQPNMGTRHDEHTPLLQDGEEADDREVRNRPSTVYRYMLTLGQILRLTDDDPANPRSWPRWRKLANVAVIAFMASIFNTFPFTARNG
jgi:hypothetical protein